MGQNSRIVPINYALLQGDELIATVALIEPGKYAISVGSNIIAYLEKTKSGWKTSNIPPDSSQFRYYATLSEVASAAYTYFKNLLNQIKELDQEDETDE